MKSAVLLVGQAAIVVKLMGFTGPTATCSEVATATGTGGSL
ncbi:MAG TPA: hypothetical protein VFC74_08240 [Oscillospiraceae bacterium]|nr:hypothetical protein [Oscillospiraceae bacterium]